MILGSYSLVSIFKKAGLIYLAGFLALSVLLLNTNSVNAISLDPAYEAETISQQVNWCGGAPGDGRTYCRRNCTSYVAYKLSKLGVSAAHYQGNGHGKDWDDNARAKNIPMGSEPKVGAVAYWNTGGGGWGHVGWVDSVNADKSVNTSNYNGLTGEFYTQMSARPDGYIYFSNVDVQSTGRMMLINGAGAAYAKDSPSAGWTQMTAVGDAKAIAAGGNRMMLISGCGAAYYKDSLTASWTQQTTCGDAKSIAVGSTGRMMLINGAGAAYAKDSPSAGWTQMTAVGDAKAIAAGGNRMMLISGCGAAYYKDSLTASWTQQTTCGDAKSIAVGSTGRMMLINGAGAAYAKDSPSAGWTQMTAVGDAKAIAAGGNRMMLISGCGAAYYKDSLTASWTQQTTCGDAKSIAVGSTGRMMLINGAGAAYAKDSPSAGWTQMTAVGDAKAIFCN